MNENRIKDLERTLRGRLLTRQVRRTIRRAKIAIIDDQLEELQGFLDGLRAEGFTNLLEFEEVEAVNDLIDADLDLVILDLVGVAGKISAHDGVGVLSSLKRADPSLPVLVVSGNAVTPTLARALAGADAIRAKPILPADLAHEVEELLKTHFDAYWAGLAVLRELRELTPDRAEELSLFQRAKLWYVASRLARDIEKNDPKAAERIISIASTASRIGTNAMKLTGIARRLSGSL